MNCQFCGTPLSTGTVHETCAFSLRTQRDEARGEIDRLTAALDAMTKVKYRWYAELETARADRDRYASNEATARNLLDEACGKLKTVTVERDGLIAYVADLFGMKPEDILGMVKVALPVAAVKAEFEKFKAQPFTEKGQTVYGIGNRFYTKEVKP